MEEVLAELQKTGEVPRLLLHSCCAPCSSRCLEVLSEHFLITDYYYNPNITEEEEYRKRAEELQRLIGAMPLPHAVTYAEGPFEPEAFFRAAEGLEEEPEGGRRCEACFRLRLFEAARFAAEAGIPYLTTSLTISPLKDAQLLNTIGEEAAEQYYVDYAHRHLRYAGSIFEAVYVYRIQFEDSYDNEYTMDVDANSGYNPQDPYVNRDPRLSDYIIYNGTTFRRIDIITGNYPNSKGESTDNRNNRDNYSTRTGYYLKKLLRDDVSPATSGSEIKQWHVYPRIVCKHI